MTKLALTNISQVVYPNYKNVGQASFCLSGIWSLSFANCCESPVSDGLLEGISYYSTLVPVQTRRIDVVMRGEEKLMVMIQD